MGGRARTQGGQGGWAGWAGLGRAPAGADLPPPQFIHTLENQREFSARAKVYFASLLTVALHGKLEYYTDIMRTLFLELMEQYVVAKNPKLMLRRCVGRRVGLGAAVAPGALAGQPAGGVGRVLAAVGVHWCWAAPPQNHPLGRSDMPPSKGPGSGSRRLDLGMLAGGGSGA